MQIPLKKILEIADFSQIISYFFVGGCAAIVEWLLFAVFANVLGVNYLSATALAFIFSTAVNWVMGRLWTFKDNVYEGKAIREGLLIYAASGAGLIINLGLMYFFVTILKMNSPIKKVAAKIIATGMVFFWNFYIRKLFIYRKN